jgi:hypothetical protein
MSALWTGPSESIELAGIKVEELLCEVVEASPPKETDKHPLIQKGATILSYLDDAKTTAVDHTQSKHD